MGGSGNTKVLSRFVRIFASSLHRVHFLELNNRMAERRKLPERRRPFFAFSCFTIHITQLRQHGLVVLQ
jgi:hypothetical protein